MEAFDFCVDSLQRSTPNKVQHTKMLPYSNTIYDFDGTIGYATYEERSLVYTGQVIAADSTQLDERITAIEAWLMNPVQAVLQDTATPKYHYLAKCTSVVPAEQGEYAELTITFSAYPLKIMNQSVSEIEWDSFNFDFDSLPVSTFNVSAGDVIVIYNTGSSEVLMECSVDDGNGATLTVKIDGETHKLSSGRTSFNLLPGENKIEIVTVPQTVAKLEFNWIEEKI